jgi:membrane-bound lytic murein transglycosylase D
MLALMKHSALVRLTLGLLPVLALTAGCAGPVANSVRPGTWPAWATPGTTADSLAADSLAADADWLLDSLAVPIDSLGSAAAEVPDISDSLAAATQARLPSEKLFDYPVVINRRVLSYIDFFLGRSRNLFEGGLRRSGRYLPMARQIFQEEGIPQDLVFLAHVESSFKYNARSRARAVGLWQFIRGTAVLYHLRCDAYVDERLDPERETRAAARYLRDLYEHFGDWHLALAAYNTGAGNVDRAIARAGTRDFWRLAETRHLMNETRGFVPAILAATILAKSPGAYGLTEETDPPLAYDVVQVSAPVDLRVLARCSGATLGELQRLNPALLLLQTPPNAGAYEVRVPPGLGEQTAREITRIPPEDRLVFQRHTVRRGENLAAIAHRYSTTVRTIQDANRLGRSTMIRTGQSLLIPSRGPAESTLAEVARGEQESVQHRVKRGETLSKIATRYGVSVRAIQSANRLASPNRLSVGQALVIPVPQTAAAEAPVAAPAAPPAGVPETPRTSARVSGSVRPPNSTCDLGRGPSTAHLVAQARQEILTGPEPAPLAEAPGPAAPEAKPAATHTVRRGDTLGKIAARYGTDVAHLLRWNGLRSSRLIYPGQKIRVTSPGASLPDDPKVSRESAKASSPGETARDDRRVHVVRRGDSLWKIAQRYGVRLGDLMAWNGLRRATRIYPGQKLLIGR